MGDVNSFLLFLTTDSFSPDSWIHHVCCGNWKVISYSCQMLPATDSSSIPSMFADREEKNVSAGKVKFSIVDFFHLTTKLPNHFLISIQTQLVDNRQGITSKDEQHQIWNHFSNPSRAFPVLHTGFGWKVKFSTVDFIYLTTMLPDNLLISFQTGSQHNRRGNQIKHITVILEGLPCALDLGVSNGVYYAEAENMKS